MPIAETLRTGYLKKSEMEELSQRIRVLSTGINQLMFANGAPLDVDLMRTPIEEGRTPVNIVLLKAINGEAEKQNFLLEVSRAIYTWMLQQSGDDLNLVFHRRSRVTLALIQRIRPPKTR